MVKKLITGTAVAATMLMLAGGAFAGYHHYSRYSKGDSNTAVVSGNNVVSVANTGLNFQRGSGEQDIDTGDAISTAGQDIVANSSTCGCEERGGRDHNTTKNEATITGNNVVSLANSGANFQSGVTYQNSFGPTLYREGHHSRQQESEQDIDTGDADAYAWQTIVVNSSTE